MINRSNIRCLSQTPVVCLLLTVLVLMETPVEAQVGFTDEQFEQWVFQQYGNAASARARLKEALELHIEDLNGVCSLTSSQTAKLRLAGRGDVVRFFRRFETVKAKFQKVRNDQQKVNQIWQDISPLQVEISTGLFHCDSLLHKSLVNTLNREQFLKFAAYEDERRLFRHKAKVQLVITMLDNAAPLTSGQRETLIGILENDVKPLKKPGQYDYYAMMYRVSDIAEEKLKPHLDEIQWKVFNQHINQYRGMEQWLKQNGFLMNEEDEEPLLPDEQVAAQ